MHRTPSRRTVSAEQFALRFRLLMSYHDLTLKEIASATHSAVSTVGTWKNGRVPSTARALNKLAEIFHVTPEYLLYGLPGKKGSQHEPMGPPVDTVASKILEELEHFIKNFEGGSVQEAWERSAHYGSKPGKPSAGPYSGKASQQPSPAARRKEIERYMRDYLDRAERLPGGLEHAWIQFQREFPLDYYKGLR